MTTRKSSTKAAKSSNRGTKVTNVNVSNVVMAAPVGSGVSSSSSPAAVAVGASGVAAPAKVRNNFESQLENALTMENTDIKLVELRTRIASRWAAPRFEDSSDYTAVVAAVAALPTDIKDRAINGARLAWLARPENAATACTLSDVINEITSNYGSEFAAACGCPCPSVEDARLFSLTALSVTTITADSNINDYINTRPIPAGLSAAAMVAAVMSIRHIVAIKSAIRAAVAAARCDLFNAAEMVARKALRLGVNMDVLTRYMGIKMAAVNVADEKEIKRLSRNLERCTRDLAAVSAAVVVRCIAVSDVDTSGDFIINRGATLPKSASAKVRKLWAKRANLLSSVDTLNSLIKTGC